MHLKVKKFDMTAIKPHRILLMVAKRSSGKSCLLFDAMSNMRDRFDYCMAFCPTLDTSSKLREHMPACCIYDRFIPSKVDSLVKLASDLASQGKERSFLLILDDCMFDKSVSRNSALRYAFYNGRHIRLTVMVICQAATDLTPEMRSQVDIVFALKEGNIQNRLKLYNMYFGIFSTFDDFNTVFSRCTQNFECLVLDNTKSTTEPQDCCFWYKAKVDHSPFKLGRRVFFRLEDAHRRTSPLALAPEEPAEASKKTKPKLVVCKEDDDDENER